MADRANVSLFHVNEAGWIDQTSRVSTLFEGETIDAGWHEAPSEEELASAGVAGLSDLLFRSYDVVAGVIGNKISDSQPRVIAVDEFFDLFTSQERKAMRRVARGDMIAVPPVLPDDDVADLIHQIDIKTKPINLDSPRLAMGLDLLIARGVLGQGTADTPAARKAQIIAGEAPTPA
jgi:hypothetical protein